MGATSTQLATSCRRKFLCWVNCQKIATTLNSFFLFLRNLCLNFFFNVTNNIFYSTESILERRTKTAIKQLSLKEPAARVYSCKICEIFKNTYFEGHQRTTASPFSNNCLFSFSEISRFFQQFHMLSSTHTCAKA